MIFITIVMYIDFLQEIAKGYGNELFTTLTIIQSRRVSYYYISVTNY